MSKTFHLIYDILATNNNGKEPMMNILAWYGLERTKEDFGKNYDDEFESVAEHPYNCIIFLRSKHRPDCYYAKGDEQIIISPAIAEMNGIFPIVREEDMEKLTPEKVYEIYREISISKEKLQKILEQNNIKVVMTRNTDAGLYSEGATNKKAEDMAVQGAGIVFFLHGFVGGNGLSAVDIFLRDVPPHGAVDGSPVQKSIGAVQTGLDGGSHQPQVELCRLQGVGAHILVGEGEQRRAHGQRGKDGKKAHPPHDLPPQRETMAALHSGASFPVIFCILSFIQY